MKRFRYVWQPEGMVRRGDATAARPSGTLATLEGEFVPTPPDCGPWIAVEENGQTRIGRVDCAVVRRIGMRGWLGARRGADGSLVTSTHEVATSAEARQLADILSSLLEATHGAGRPVGKNPDPYPTFVADATRVYWELTDSNGCRPSDAEVGRGTNFEPPMFSKLKKHYFTKAGRPWPPPRPKSPAPLIS